MKSIINHLYWSAASTPDGNADEIREKWTSVNNHIHNVHRGHGKIFKKCAHPRLRGRQKRKKWFKPRKCLYVCKLLEHNSTFSFLDTKASEKLSKIITNTAFCRDVGMLSPFYQTSRCEAFHSVVIHFAPKSTGFSYKGMLARYS